MLRLLAANRSEALSLLLKRTMEKNTRNQNENNSQIEIAMSIANLPVSVILWRYQVLCRALLVGAALLLSTSGATAQGQISIRPDAPAQRASGFVSDNKTSAAPVAPVVAGPASSPQSGDVNSYGFSALWQQGDWVTKGCLLLLGLMSFANWCALLAKQQALSRLKTQTLDDPCFY